MQAELVKRLLELNRRFYTAFARDFEETRSSAGLNLAPIMPYLSNGVKLLDVGCGNGRLAERLDAEGYRLAYTGVDVTSPLIALADARKAKLRSVTAEFRVADITALDWARSMQDRAPFDLVLALAVLHHIPSFDLRCQVLRDLRALLVPGGRLIMSNWQFTQAERLKKKIVSPTVVGMDAAALEPGDAVLDWKRGGIGYRYVHLVTAEEVEQLAEASGLKVVEQFLADADLNLFSVMEDLASDPCST